ncbi:tRNA preQ1(34) S-adenosylmethionine ribosyltransferase-isomerase QueA [Candidatus Woesearchaeota archaeon]|nr:tRNA preQ1(34) S-adenosylmethionine ribosyltransferase-isomerase QueA [Candidatus Woesearchaeota archaeon]
MNLSSFNYKLPKELIAQTPSRPKDSCNLMVLKGSKTLHKKFYNILDLLEPGDVLVLNKSKVIPARLKGKKTTGTKAEFIITNKTKQGFYECSIKSKRLKIGNEFIFSNNLKAKLISENTPTTFLVKFNNPNLNTLLKKIGELPTPPYIKQKVKPQDYQTIYASAPGSFAAPTAGLHFTKKLLKKIKDKGVKLAFITLHIDISTFLPISEQDITKHKTGKECFHITKTAADTINSCKPANKIIAVGTTTLKALESSSYKKGKLLPKKDCSELFIYPSYKFKSKVSALITNFHLPKSSLLLLTSAFAGTKRLLKAYKTAVKKKYRFYSLGDGMIIFK